MWPIAERGLRRRLRYLTAPTLVVHGGDDGLLPVSYAEEMVRLIDGASLVVIDRAGHYPMFEQEDAFIEAVEAFLVGVTPLRAACPGARQSTETNRWAISHSRRRGPSGHGSGPRGRGPSG